MKIIQTVLFGLLFPASAVIILAGPEFESHGYRFPFGFHLLLIILVWFGVWSLGGWVANTSRQEGRNDGHKAGYNEGVGRFRKVTEGELYHFQGMSRLDDGAILILDVVSSPTAPGDAVKVVKSHLAFLCTKDEISALQPLLEAAKRTNKPLYLHLVPNLATDRLRMMVLQEYNPYTLPPSGEGDTKAKTVRIRPD